jgi:short subunit dehydrogenase-like uncharacterized protein
VVSLSSSNAPSPDVPILPPREGRRFDIVLWGATGFTGKLVAEYLARHTQLPAKGAAGKEGASKPGDLPVVSWALAGRSQKKLEAVRASLAADHPRASELPLLLGDGGDRASLDAIVRDARVVITTVGPYALYGRELVAACADAGTDYVDLAGETPFIRDMIDRHHGRAQETGARIVHACGYDSIPSDLGTLMLQEYALEKYGTRVPHIHFYAGESKGAASGGTIASALNLIEEGLRDPKVRRIAANPYALVPGHVGRGPDGGDQRGVRFDKDSGRWTGPFVMAAINTRIVRRSNALKDYAYGKDFRYDEAMSFKPGGAGLLQASLVTAATTVFFVAAMAGPVRKLLAKTVLPAPGEGPSKELRESGYFTSRLYGTVKDKNGSARLLGTVKGTQDPGYGETAKMISESALSLLFDAGIRQAGGVLTPASCMGMPLVERLRKAGMTFDVTTR